MAGRSTANNMYKEFLETFDGGGEVEEKVTRKEFLNYYANIGANISNDAYFDLLVRNSWQLGEAPPPSPRVAAGRPSLVTKIREEVAPG